MKFLILFCLYPCLYAQTLERSVISAAGGYGGNAVATVDWTLGETLMERTPTSGQHLTQGFHQPFIITPATVNPQLPLSAIRVYPNPFQFSLHLDGEDLSMANSLELTDASGKSIFSQGIPPQKVWCLLQNLAGRQENHRIIFLTHLDNGQIKEKNGHSNHYMMGGTEMSY